MLVLALHQLHRAVEDLGVAPRLEAGRRAADLHQRHAGAGRALVGGARFERVRALEDAGGPGGQIDAAGLDLGRPAVEVLGERVDDRLDLAAAQDRLAGRHQRRQSCRLPSPRRAGQQPPAPVDRGVEDRRIAGGGQDEESVLAPGRGCRRRPAATIGRAGGGWPPSAAQKRTMATGSRGFRLGWAPVMGSLMIVGRLRQRLRVGFAVRFAARTRSRLAVYYLLYCCGFAERRGPATQTRKARPRTTTAGLEDSYRWVHAR